MITIDGGRAVPGWEDRGDAVAYHPECHHGEVVVKFFQGARSRQISEFAGKHFYSDMRSSTAVCMVGTSSTTTLMAHP
jgi:hypothetical protein